MLRYITNVKVVYSARSDFDKRKIVDRYTAEYRDQDNVEYRFSVEVERGKLPNFPEKGTAKEIVAAKKQY